eukprot:TRINITY_DN3253_c0_g1_i1.p2 TRINITY_DN3253_c0_g1~~TRINITY_DN3253_c0_g1_i1.p2  ORF type:complete len:476 (+),score=122.94 TRINITY_DN3253_c0_g1_i1:49-1428(+)
MKNQKGKTKRNKKKYNILTEPASGTRDFAPDDMRLQNWLKDTWKEVSKSFCFQEYDCPILEEQNLYERKAGEEIKEQMYCLETKEKEKLALRPEMTPSLARMVLKAGPALLMPIKYFSVPQCWRFETVQRGRKREHYQWNCDIWGVSEITAEAELLAVIVDFFKKVGLTSEDVGIKINSRRILQTVLTDLGVTKEDFAPICVIIDKLDKIGANAVQEMLAAKGVDPSVIEDILRVINISNIEELESLLPGSPVVDEMKLLWELAEGYGYADWLIFDASVVRGLAYYTGVVFECFDRAGELRAICGGGRYDTILEIYGCPPTKNIPAVGFGFGDCVIIELLGEKGLLPDLPPVIDDLIIPFDDSLRPLACKIASRLRAAGRETDIYLKRVKKVTQCYSYADRRGAKRVIFVAPDETAKGLVRMKLMRVDENSAKEFNVPLEDLEQYAFVDDAVPEQFLEE